MWPAEIVGARREPETHLKSSRWSAMFEKADTLDFSQTGHSTLYNSMVKRLLNRRPLGSVLKPYIIARQIHDDEPAQEIINP
jgi:hypothetical protein